MRAVRNIGESLCFFTKPDENGETKMSKYHILFNKSAGGHDARISTCIEIVEKLGEVELVDVEKLESHKDFISGLSPEDIIVVCGGDGTLNNYVNKLRGLSYENEVLYFPGGSGNDFYKDVGKTADPALVNITHLVKDLPVATIKGNDYLFLNGIGYGIDGYCCEVGDKKREAGIENINYTTIAIMGVLFHYKPTGATVTVDGVTHRFERVWLAPMMNGRYFGGGMMPTPDQQRNSGELSVMIFHDARKLRLLTIFPKIFSGTHTKHDKYVTVLKGKEITVAYDEPRPLQVDGETILGVSECTVRAYSRERETV